MYDKTLKLFRFLYSIVVSVMIVISGLLLIAACLQIYRSGGEQIYTPAKVAAAFAPIAMPIYITLALIAGSFLLAWFLPVEKKHLPAQKQYAFLLRKAYEKADMQLCDSELLCKLRQEQKKRRLVLSLALIIWVIGGIIFIPYACNSKNYSSELHLATDSIVAIIWRLIPCSLIPSSFSIFTAYYSQASICRETELVKLVPKTVNPPLPQTKKAVQTLLCVRMAVLVLALGMIVGGFVAGGTADVLAKAIAICTECVGLG